MSSPAPVILHGVFMEVLGLGVLLAGHSGVGKSELALELVSRGHRLVSDDAAEFALAGDGRLVGSCPPLLRGFLEVRGLGILNVERMFGCSALLEQQELDLILRLYLPQEPASPPDRLHGQRSSIDILGIAVPEIALPIRLGHNLAALAEAASRDQKLKRAGYDAAGDFVTRQQNAIALQGRLRDRNGPA